MILLFLPRLSLASCLVHCLHVPEQLLYRVKRSPVNLQPYTLHRNMVGAEVQATLLVVRFRCL